jgi:hypothetical protein
VHALADRVCAREIFAGEFFIDDGDGRGALVVVFVEKAAAVEWNFQNVEIVGLNNVAERPLHVVFIRRFGFAVDPEELLIVGTQGKSAPGLGDGFNAGSGGEFSIEVANDTADGVRMGAQHGWGQRESESNDVGGFEAGTRSPQNNEAADH